ncbi:hypothetical protein NLI96_g6888 [Meripilus lineatus]|uniref:F-box domain-containing protein n=1 Tax=Meripilus lineatus TaxID=2056292 RepID=A0AAD5V5G6_9APHY|nr:hypothetical protein NLI96_g6888 [Physisporinus lineatus]
MSPCVTIHHLPDELLVEIVNILREQKSLSPPWFHLTFVCHRWRAVILDYPLFWTKINATGDIERTQSFLERSKSFPIDLTISDYPSQDIQRRSLTSLLSDHIHRIKYLTLKPRYAEDVMQRIDSPFPILEWLNLERESGDSPLIVRFGISPPAPRLKYLWISRSTLDWNSSLYKGLSSLSLSSAFRAEPFVGDFLNVLEACPSLENLRLKDFHLREFIPEDFFEEGDVIPDDFTIPEDPRTIELPLLKKCYVSGYCESIANLLRHIDIPSCSRVSLWFLPGYDRQTSDRFWVLPSDLHTHMPLVPHSTDMQLTSRLHNLYPQFEGAQWNTDLVLTAPEVSGQPNLWIYVPLVYKDIKPNFFESAFALVQPFSITTLKIEFDFTCVTRRMWREALTGLRSLVTLRITAAHCKAQCISAAPAEVYNVLGTKADAHQVICPKLEQLHLRHVNLGPVTARLLHIALQLRALSNAKLQYLDIDDWHSRGEVQWEWPDFLKVADEFSQNKRDAETF